jgi:hypothetical protein
MKNPFVKNQDPTEQSGLSQAPRRRSDEIQKQINALNEEASRLVKRDNDLKNGDLQKSILTNDKVLSEEVYRKLGESGAFRSALPELMRNLESELKEARDSERENDITTEAIAIRKLTTDTLKRLESTLVNFEKFMDDVQKINAEFLADYGEIIHQSIANPDQYFMNENWSIFGNKTFSPKNMRLFLDELHRYCTNLDERKASDRISLHCRVNHSLKKRIMEKVFSKQA